MGYTDTTIRIDLGKVSIPQACEKHREEDDGPKDSCRDCRETPARVDDVPALADFWVEIRNPDLVPWGVKKKWQSLAFAPDSESLDERRARFEQLAEEQMRALILDWNLEDVETGEKLPKPSQDATALDRAPEVIGPIRQAMAARRAVGNATATSSRAASSAEAVA